MNTAVQKKLKMNSSLMGKAEASSSTTITTLIQGDGTFNAHKLDKFIKQVKLGKCGVSYVVVAIMGPQSSGKSTLLNHLFYTNFKEMDAEQGRQQTTKGVWIAKCAGIEPCTIVMDLEGSDGSEREDDTKFEKQSALFALAVSDIVMINMWCHDIGREQAANRPLLKTVFEVMLRLFTPRKTTLMFVIRDKTKTPFEKLESLLRNDIQNVWDSVTKPEAHKHTPLSEFFNVQVDALASYETNEEQFNEQVASLRQKFFHSIAPGGLACDRQGAVDASGFSIHAKLIWETIKANKELDLPSHKVMVATIRCDQISSEKYSSFLKNTEWLKLKKDVQSHLVSGFGKLLTSLLCNCLSSYDEETAYYEDGVTSAKRKKLEEKLLQLIQPAYNLMLKHIRSATLANFKEAVSDVLKGDGVTSAKRKQFEKNLLQLIQPAYSLMLKHIRSATLANFKEAVSDVLKGRQAVEVTVRECIEEFTRKFDEQCEDIVIKQADWDTTRTREKLLRDFDLHVTEVNKEAEISKKEPAAKKDNIFKLELGTSTAQILGGVGSLVSGVAVAGTAATSSVAATSALGVLSGGIVVLAAGLAGYAAYKAYKDKKDTREGPDNIHMKGKLG